MLIRLVTEYRWGGLTVLPGSVLKVPRHIAATMIEEGAAIPEREPAGRETRALVR